MTQQTVKAEKGMMKKIMERRTGSGGVAQLDEEKRLKEMEGEEDNRTKISISNQPALKKKKKKIHSA